MGCIVGNNNINKSTDVFNEIFIVYKYNYLKNVLNHFINNSGYNERFINNLCEITAYGDGESSLKRLSITGVKSVYDIIELLCYVPLREYYSESHLKMNHIFKSYTIKFKKNKIEVSYNNNANSSMFYKTSHDIKMNSYPTYIIDLDTTNERRAQNYYIDLEFKTICSIIDIINIECNLFTNDDWISRDFINIINDFKFVKPHTKLLEKINEWINENKEKYSNLIDEKTYIINTLKEQIQDIKNYQELRRNELNKCFNSDYNIIGTMISSAKDTSDDEIKKINNIIMNHQNTMDMYKKILTFAEKLSNVMAIKTDKNQLNIKQEEIVAIPITNDKNIDIPITEAVVIN